MQIQKNQLYNIDCIEGEGENYGVLWTEIADYSKSNLSLSSQTKHDVNEKG